MNIWPSHNAQAHFSALLNACIHEGPQIVTRRGEATAVVVPFAEWQRLHQESERPSLKELLLTDWARHEFELPARGSAAQRAVHEL